MQKGLNCHPGMLRKEQPVISVRNKLHFLSVYFGYGPMLGNQIFFSLLNVFIFMIKLNHEPEMQ